MSPSSGLCLHVLSVFIYTYVGGGVPAPTSRPSTFPSRIPTRSPSSLPSRIPSRFPSALPLKLPTSVPSRLPSGPPTFSPTGISSSEVDAICDLATTTDIYNFYPEWDCTVSVVDVCGWTGVTCKAGHIQAIILSNVGTSGYISSSIGSLTYISTLDLSTNYLSGTIPSSIGLLSSVTTLKLTENIFSKTIPSALGSLSSLKYIDLSYNLFTGPIPIELSTLTQLTSLQLQRNKFSNTFPSAFFSLNRLVRLDLSYNSFYSTLPKEISLLSSLQTVNIFSNYFTSSIPSSIAVITSMKSLNLGYNYLGSSIPPQISAMRQLTYLSLFYNSLVGSIPSQISTLTALAFLDLSTNHLSKSIPSQISQLRQLTQLALASNKLSTAIPAQLYSLTNMLILDISYNFLTGSIPSQYSSLKKLQVLKLFYNYLSQNIPTSLKSLSSLLYLDLHSNYISGVIPSTFTSLSQLTYADFSSNYLSGTLTPQIGNIPSLQHLNLYYNYMTKPIPSQLSNLKSITFLSLSANKFDGTIGTFIGALSTLQYLGLSSNCLSGNLPSELSSLSQLTHLSVSLNYLEGTIPVGISSGLSVLQVLNMTSNSFSGIIPTGLFSITTLTYLNLQGNKLLLGSLPSTLSLPSLEYLDLSDNRLSHALPTSLGASTALTFLDLNNNTFTGTLPSQLGKLVSLTRLDVARNSLRGLMPEGIGSLLSLLELDVHSNQFSGSIPTFFSKLPSLTLLKLNKNRFNSVIPDQLFTMTALQLVDLSFNSLVGSVPSAFVSLFLLSSLSIQGNLLTGSVPSQLCSLNYLASLSVYGTFVTCYSSCLSKLLTPTTLLDECNLSPTPAPSRTPSVRPSASPSNFPTRIPTRTPSVQPSSQPTVATQPPTTSSPTAVPTTVPSPHPSFTPSSFPSSSPTASPTAKPTVIPSSAPSVAPSSDPSSIPSAAPSEEPTTVPSNEPSVSPTLTPSAVPSRRPTARPTVLPSRIPSMTPISSPTTEPSLAPSVNPSSSPSLSPSRIPTATPTIAPSVLPSLLPSSTPTFVPSDRPSRNPTTTPSTKPSPKPSTVPTSFPSVTPTAEPSAEPTSSPTTSRPTVKPTITPSEAPIIGTRQPTSVNKSPTNMPTRFPSSHPSASPSFRPTRHPSVKPTLQPSSVPSTIPTEEPSDLPTTEPTSPPSSIPSVLPSIAPSVTPSTMPSDIPSVIPSADPSSGPSSTPSLTPTNLPSLLPSSSPSTEPSFLPSSLPSEEPSSLPTDSPTYVPSSTPSTKPSHRPSLIPSSTPSFLPTVIPSVFPSVAPSSAPSYLPSAPPSTVPSAVPTSPPTSLPSKSPSSKPSNSPSDLPSILPSSLPSESPTSTPSLEPTSEPSEVPSSIPTDTPSEDPSIAPTLQPAARPAPRRSPSPTARPTRKPTSAPKVVPTSSPTVTPPLYPVSVILRVPTLVGACSDLIIDASSSYGDVGRPWKKIVWNVFSYDTAGSDAILSKLPTTTYDLQLPVTISSTLLTPRYFYIISLSLTNFQNVSDIKNVKLDYFNSTVYPTVTVIGSSSFEIKPSESVSKRVQVSVPSCLSTSSYTINYNWEVYKWNTTTFTWDFLPLLVSRSNNPTVFTSNPYTFSSNQLYKLSFNASLSYGIATSDKSLSSTSIDIFLNVTKGPVAAVIAGGGGVTRFISPTGTILLDASNSRDEDMSPTLPQGLSYLWSCFHATNASTCGSIAAAKAQIFATTLSPGGSYIFTVTVIGSRNRNASDFVRVMIGTVATSISTSLTTLSTSTNQVNSNQKLELIGRITGNTGVQVSWSDVSGSNSNVLTTVNTLTPLRSTFNLSDSQSAVSFPLVIKSGVLKSGQYYTFRLTAGTVYTERTFYIRISPSDGYFFVSPTNGMALETQFTLLASGWVAEESDYPLQYEFSYSLDQLMTVSMSLQPSSDLKYCQTLLPASSSKIIYLILRVIGMTGVETLAYNQSFVSNSFSLSSSSYLSTFLDAIVSARSNPLTKSDTDNILQVVNLYSSVLNSVNCSAVSSKYCNSIHRAECSSVPNTCGSCLAGYDGVAGSFNGLCILSSSSPSQRRRLLTSPTSCVKNSDCIYGFCQNRLCKIPWKSCPSANSNICSGHGTCHYNNTYTRASVDNCTADSQSCRAYCRCDEGYGGIDCSLDQSSISSISRLRSQLCWAIVDASTFIDVNDASLPALLNSFLVSFNPYELVLAEDIHGCLKFLELLYIDSRLLKSPDTTLTSNSLTPLSSIISNVLIGVHNDYYGSFSAFGTRAESIIQNLINMHSLKTIDDMTDGQNAVTLSTDNFHLRVYSSRMSSLFNAKILSPVATNNAQSYFILPADGLSGCGYDGEFVQFSILEWISLPYTNSNNNIKGLSNHVLRFSSMNKTVESTTLLSTTTTSTTSSVTTTLGTSHPYTVVFQWPEAQDWSQSTPNCTNLGLDPSFCSCRVASYTRFNATLRCPDVRSLCGRNFTSKSAMVTVSEYGIATIPKEQSTVSLSTRSTTRNIDKTSGTSAFTIILFCFGIGLLLFAIWDGYEKYVFTMNQRVLEQKKVAAPVFHLRDAFTTPGVRGESLISFKYLPNNGSLSQLAEKQIHDLQRSKAQQPNDNERVPPPTNRTNSINNNDISTAGGVQESFWNRLNRPGDLLGRDGIGFLYLQALLRNHSLVSIFSFGSLRFTRVLRFISLCTTVIFLIFVDTLFYKLAFPTDNNCSDHSTRDECVDDSSRWIDGDDYCIWHDDNKDCTLRTPSDDSKYHLIVALIVIAVTLIPLMFYRWLLESVLTKAGIFGQSCERVPTSTVAAPARPSSDIGLPPFGVNPSSSRQKPEPFPTFDEAENTSNNEIKLENIRPPNRWSVMMSASEKRSLQYQEKVSRIQEDVNNHYDPDGHLRNKVVIQHFIEENLRGIFQRTLIRIYFFQSDHAKPSSHGISLPIITTLLVLATWIFFIIYIYLWLIDADDKTVYAWGITLILTWTIQVFFIDVIGIFFYYVLPITILRPHLQRIYTILERNINNELPGIIESGAVGQLFSGSGKVDDEDSLQIQRAALSTPPRIGYDSQPTLRSILARYSTAQDTAEIVSNISATALVVANLEEKGMTRAAARIILSLDPVGLECLKDRKIPIPPPQPRGVSSVSVPVSELPPRSPSTSAEMIKEGHIGVPL